MPAIRKLVRQIRALSSDGETVPLTSVVELVETFRGEAEAIQRRSATLDQQFNDFVGALASLAALDFSGELEVTGESEYADAIATGINMLAEELQHSAVSLDFVRDIIDSMAEPLVVTDAGGVIRLANAAAARLTGRDIASLAEDHVSTLGGHTREEVARLLEQLEPDATAEALVEFRHVDGRRAPVSLSVRRLRQRGDRPSLYVWVGKDISARLELERELRSARDEAVATAAAKSEFLANMSHEIRTPMNAVIGMTGLLLETELGAQQRRFVEVVRASGESLLALINDILDFSKIEAGGLQFEHAPMSVRECVEGSLDVVASAAAAKQLELITRVEHEVPVAIYGDVTRVQQTLINLLSNAIKFTEEGEVTLGVRARPAPGDDDDSARVELEFTVRDTGIGIHADALSGLFDAFSQAESSTTRRFGGTGLGLAISRRLVEGMDGRIWVESALGEGSTFGFTIPAAVAPRPRPQHLARGSSALAGARALVLADNPRSLESLTYYLDGWGVRVRAASSREDAIARARESEAPFDVGLLDTRARGADAVRLVAALRETTQLASAPLISLSALGQRDADPAHAEFRALLAKPVKPSRLYEVLRAALRPTPPGAPEPHHQDRAGASPPLDLRVLLAEDNGNNQLVAKLSLARLGLRADVVSDGEEALRAVRSIPYDVILMDVHMPRLDGLEATRRIRADATLDQPYIVAVTARATVQDRQDCLDAGMNDHMSKPYRLRDLRRVFARFRERTRAAEAEQPAELTANEEAPKPTVEVVDVTALETLAELAGAETRVELAPLVDRLAAGLTRLVDAAEQAVAQDDTRALHLATHSLRSNAAALGAKRLAAAAAAIEQAVRDEEPGATARAPELRRELNLYHARLTELRAREGWSSQP